MKLVKLFSKKAILFTFSLILTLQNESIAQIQSPEYTSFEPVNANNLVELISGDFTYNIPLFDVPGIGGSYPVHLFYHGGITMEQEASWTGLGWNINVGSIGRSIKGFPDDCKNFTYFNATKKEFIGDSKFTREQLPGDRNSWNIGKGREVGFYRVEQKGSVEAKINDAMGASNIYGDDIKAYGTLYFKDALSSTTSWGRQSEDVVMDSYINPYSSSTYSSSHDNDINNSLVFPDYDNYIVTANGLIGNMTPKIFEFGSIVRRGYKESVFDSKSDDEESEYVPSRELVYNNRYPFSKPHNEIHFCFEGENSGYLKVESGSFSSPNVGGDPIWNNSYSGSDLVSEVDGKSFYDATEKRKGGKKYVQWYTNSEMDVGQSSLAERGIMEYEPILGQRDDALLFDENGIGGYSITTEDGTTYHYALPIYNFSECRVNENIDNPYIDFYESGTYNKYATSWLLTAITGSDFIDKGTIGVVDDEDLGYWVRFDYGKWTDGYMWQVPYVGYNKISENRGAYSNGRKQVYYLNYIRTKTHTAYFIKDLRDDALGKDKFKSNDRDATVTSYGGFAIFKGTYRSFDVPEKARLLRLAKIILVKNEDLTINKAAGFDLISTKTGHTYSTTFQGVSYGGSYSLPETTTTGTFDINYNDNVIDVNDIEGLESLISEKALKVVNFEYDYSLCKGTPNTTNPGLTEIPYVASSTSKGKLTLKTLSTMDRQNVLDFPKYKFDYYNSTYYNLDYQDEWGYYVGSSVSDPSITNKDEFPKPDANSWSLKEITTPLGARIKINYESDSYSREAFRSTLVSSLKPMNMYLTSPSLLTFKLKEDIKNPRLKFAVNNLYEIQYVKESGLLDFVNPKYYKGYNKLVSINLATNELTFEINTNVNIKASLHVTQLSKTNSKYDPSRIFLNTDYKVGGGLRVKEILVDDGMGNKHTTSYRYDNPITGITSGVTAYGPTREHRYIPYIYELPSPEVIYKYVTVKNVNINGGNTGEVLHQFKVYDDHVNEKGLSYSMGGVINIGDIQSPKEIASLAAPSQNHKYHVIARSATIFDNLGVLGKPLNNKTYDKEGNLLFETSYDYYSPGEIKSGITQETFCTARQDIVWEKSDHVKSESTHYMTSTSKINYPCILKSITTIKNGLTQKITNTKFDFYSGVVTETKTETSTGEKHLSKTVPAYANYGGIMGNGNGSMGSKVYNVTNKNMLVQPTASYTYAGDVADEDHLLSASVETWNKNWNYREYTGSAYANTPEADVWRKHQSYVWQAPLNANGTVSSFVDFTWSGSPNDGWKKTNEVTLYNHYSQPIESKDINGNYAAVKMGGQYDHFVIASSSVSNYNSFMFSSFEDLKNVGSRTPPAYYFGGEVALNQGEQVLADGVSGHPTKAHSGTYVAKIDASKDGPKYSVKSALQTGQTYRASVWVHKNSPANTQLVVQLDGEDGVTHDDIYVSATMNRNDAKAVTVGDWVLLKVNIAVPKNYVHSGGANGENDLKVYVKNLASSGVAYIDDMRLQPIKSPVTGYVYEERTGLLKALLDNENFATYYTYDGAGRLTEIHKETASGIKKVSKTDYHYGRP